jgi:hypothetical protein
VRLSRGRRISNKELVFVTVKYRSGRSNAFFSWAFNVYGHHCCEFWPRIEHEVGVYFQQDGAPPYYALCVREWFDMHFEGRWIGRRGPLEWPARSPDLTSTDFVLWGVLKDLVCKNKLRNVDELKDTIRDNFADISVELCLKTCLSVVGRVRECLARDGQHFEHYT